MKLKFKKKVTYSRKGNITYCTLTCMVEKSNIESRIEDVLPRKYWKECRELEAAFIKYEYEDSNKRGLTYKAICTGKAEKSAEDGDNLELAQKIAKARARLQCYKYAEAICSAMFHCLKEFAYGNLLVTTKTPECTSNGGLYDQWLSYSYLVEKEEYYIKKLLSEP